MFGTLNKILIVTLLLTGVALFGLYKYSVSVAKERDRYIQNTDGLLSDIKRFRVDSATTAVDVKTLRLTVDEFKQYRKADTETIKKLGIRINSIQSASKHELEINAPIKTQLKDTVVIRDTIPIILKKVEMNTPYLKVNAIIENNELIGRIQLPVTLNQLVWVEHKHRFLWWRWGVKAIHQTISVDNPYVEVKYSERISIQK